MINIHMYAHSYNIFSIAHIVIVACCQVHAALVTGANRSQGVAENGGDV